MVYLKKSIFLFLMALLLCGIGFSVTTSQGEICYKDSGSYQGCLNAGFTVAMAYPIVGYWSNNEDYSLISWTGGTTLATRTQIAYRTPTTATTHGIPASWSDKDLSDNICEVNGLVLSGDVASFSPSLISYPVSLPTSFLNRGHYMKAMAVIRVTHPDLITYDYIQPTTTSGTYSYVSGNYNQAGSAGSTLGDISQHGYTSTYNAIRSGEKVPYVLLKPGSNSITFPLSTQIAMYQGLCDSGNTAYCGNYNYEVIVIPIDGKCDFNDNGNLNGETDYATYSNAFTISVPDSDGDGVPDSADICSGGDDNLDTDTDGVPNFCDICSGFDDSLDADTDGLPDDCDDCETRDWSLGSATNMYEFSGCPYRYTLSSACTGRINFAENLQRLRCSYYDCWFCDNDNYISFNGNEIGGAKDIEDIEYYPALGTGTYSCYNEDNGPDQYLGQCGLTAHAAVSSITCSYDGKIYSNGVYDMYQFSALPSGMSCGSLSQSFTCNFGSWDTNPSTTLFRESYCYVNENYQLSDLRIDFGNGWWESDDDYKIGKFKFDPKTNKTYYKKKDLTEDYIALPTVTNEKSIKIIKNGVNIRNDTIRPEYIAMKVHQIKRFENPTQATDYVSNSYDLMTKLNITKDLDTISNPGKTIVKIKLDIPESQRVNITVYQIVPKSIAADLSQITLINNSGAQFFVEDKDPVIGWYFNESDGNESIEYEVPGVGEGGTIIITQEPILFNEGELIVSYRDVDCNPDEVQLFELDDLTDSKIYAPGTGAQYRVCLAHITENLALGTTLANSWHILNYTDSGNMSLTQTMSTSLDVSVADTSIYWDVRVSKDNPTGTYSCIGSMANEDNSLFGDCGYTTKRLWIHLGDDIIPPNTTLVYPYVAHKMRIELEAEDNIGGSGLAATYYCIEENGNTCTDPIADFTPYTDSFLVTCAESWGCLKNIHYFSRDVAGNFEPINTYELTLIEQGSACQVDCTAKPKPNRYMKECRNLNGCEYYRINNLGNYDDGEYVANQCHYLTENSWTSYNDTHEIKCPIGPFRPKMFTPFDLILKDSFCDDIAVIPYNVLINGESVTMNLVYCESKE